MGGLVKTVARRCVICTAWCGMSAWTVGCDLATTGAKSTYDGDLEPIADRLMAFYPDLRTARFQIIADFESPEQGSVFRLYPPTAATFVGISTERSRPETGAGALKVALTSRAQQLVIEDTVDSDWTFPRDWGGYQLFLASVFSPRPVSGLAIVVRSGGERQAEYVTGGIALAEGWNLLRLDVAEISDVIDITDVREMRWRFEALDAPIEIFIDDVVLVDNGNDVFGSRHGEPGDLYVRAEGQRFRIGAVDRFELVFAGGRVVRWFDLGQDPERVRNLSGPGPIGPLIVPLPEGALGPADRINVDEDWAPLGPTVQTRQEITEATPVRVILATETRYVAPTAPEGRDVPTHRRVYTIYPNGRVYMEVSATVASGPFAPSRVGLVIACSARVGFERVLHPARTDADASSAASCAYVLYRRTAKEQADLLFAPHSAASLPLMRLVDERDNSRMRTLLYGPSEEATAHWAAILNVWPSDIDAAAQADSIVLDYCHPMPIELDIGRLVRTDPGDFNNDGYNESRGHYVLEPDGKAVTLRIDGRSILRFQPAFKIVDVAERDVWLYVDGRLLKNLARDELGDIIFQIPRVVDKETLVEVITREREADSVASK